MGNAGYMPKQNCETTAKAETELLIISVGQLATVNDEMTAYEFALTPKEHCFTYGDAPIEAGIAVIVHETGDVHMTVTALEGYARLETMEFDVEEDGAPDEPASGLAWLLARLTERAAELEAERANNEESMRDEGLRDGLNE